MRTFKTIEELRAELVAFARRYNETWLVARHGYKTPARVREEQTMPRIAVDPTFAATYPWPPEQAQPGVSKPCRTTAKGGQAPRRRMSTRGELRARGPQAKAQLRELCGQGDVVPMGINAEAKRAAKGWGQKPGGPDHGGDQPRRGCSSDILRSPQKDGPATFASAAQDWPRRGMRSRSRLPLVRFGVGPTNLTPALDHGRALCRLRASSIAAFNASRKSPCTFAP